MRGAHTDVSERRVCRVLQVARTSMRGSGTATKRTSQVSETLAIQVQALIEQHPTYGYRRLWALLRYGQGQCVNRKAVYRLLRIKHWLLHQRRPTERPRARRRRNQALQGNHRWAIDVTHIPCGQDGWGHLTAVIDYHDREVIGYEFALRGRAKEAERALEASCLARFGTLRPQDRTPMVRSVNGLIFKSRRFRQACRDYRLQQEFFAPYTPEQNGLIERFFRSLKEECVWQHRFDNFEFARRAITRWVTWYYEGRPHQAL